MSREEFENAQRIFRIIDASLRRAKDWGEGFISIGNDDIRFLKKKLTEEQYIAERLGVEVLELWNENLNGRADR